MTNNSENTSKNGDNNNNSASFIKEAKDWIDFIQSSFGLMYKFAVGLGAIVIIVYCLHIGFHPKGLTVGDVLLLLFAVFAFAFIDIGGVIVGAAAMFLPLALFGKIISALAIYKFDESKDIQRQAVEPSKPGKFEHIKSKLSWSAFRPISATRNVFLYVTFGLIGIGFFVSFLILLFDYKNQNSLDKLFLLLAFVAGGLWLNLGFLFERAPHPKDEKKSDTNLTIKQKIALLCLVVSIPILVEFVAIVNASMRMIGIRTEGVPVQLSDANYSKVISIAKKFGIAVSDCRSEDSNSHIVYGIDVLWHGIGDTAYIHIGEPVKSNSGKPFAEFDIKDEGTSPIKTKQKGIPCFDLKADTLFDLHKWEIKSGSEAVLKNDFGKKLGNVEKISKVTVIGYSDPLPAHNPDNWTLSDLRAKAIKKWLIQK